MIYLIKQKFHKKKISNTTQNRNSKPKIETKQFASKNNTTQKKDKINNFETMSQNKKIFETKCVRKIQ